MKNNSLESKQLLGIKTISRDQLFSVSHLIFPFGIKTVIVLWNSLYRPLVGISGKGVGNSGGSRGKIARKTTYLKKPLI